LSPRGGLRASPQFALSAHAGFQFWDMRAATPLARKRTRLFKSGLLLSNSQIVAEAPRLIFAPSTPENETRGKMGPSYLLFKAAVYDPDFSRT